MKVRTLLEIYVDLIRDRNIPGEPTPLLWIELNRAVGSRIPKLDDFNNSTATKPDIALELVDPALARSARQLLQLLNEVYIRPDSKGQDNLMLTKDFLKYAGQEEGGQDTEITLSLLPVLPEQLSCYLTLLTTLVRTHVNHNPKWESSCGCPNYRRWPKTYVILLLRIEFP